MSLSILHIAFNAHLISDSFNVFEKFYPNQNYLICCPVSNGVSRKIRLPESKIEYIDFENKKFYDNIMALCIKRSVNIILLHALTYANIQLAKYLKEKTGCKVYWLFWGFELYNALQENVGESYVDGKFNPFRISSYYSPNKFKGLLRYLRYGYKSVDIIKAAQGIVDYFCFWTDIDYKIYVKHFGESSIRFKKFGYVCRYKSEICEREYIFPRKVRAIIVNHQASVTGNHQTVMKKIKKIDKNGEYNIIMPLSYGSKFIRKECLKYGKKYFGDKFKPILNYMPQEEYFSSIEAPQVAIFGQKRQEATGNIGRLLIRGTKVFLRNENPMLEYYKNLGYIIYSFENDLNTINDLQPLKKEQMIHNRNVWYDTRTYYEDFMYDLFK